MSSPPMAGAAEDLQGDPPNEDLPENLDMGKIQLQDDKAQEGKKKKKKSRSAKKKITGFEEYYCDPPITPAEHIEEQEVIYAPHRPFVDRIEECIQRYRARRRLGPERENLFSKYLTLGGVDATVRQFQGTRALDNDVLKDASKATVREITADDVIQRGGDGNLASRFYNPNHPEHWDVDFTGVAAGFLSEHLPTMAVSDTKYYQMGVEVVLNFLKYVDMHDVCPEYHADVMGAQLVCKKALHEMPAIWKLSDLLPGDFNTAVSIVYCKTGEERIVSGNQARMAADRKYAQLSQGATLAIILGNKTLPTDYKPTVTKTIALSFEVCKINFPDVVARAKYISINRYLSEYPDIKPCGTFTARPVVIRDGWENTMVDSIPEEYLGESCFVLEEEILKLLNVGMKLTMRVGTFGYIGLRFIEEIKSVKPSFYVFLPQELMLQFKEPVLNPRPAPSVHDFDGSGNLLDGIPDGGDDE